MDDCGVNAGLGALAVERHRHIPRGKSRYGARSRILAQPGHLAGIHQVRDPARIPAQPQAAVTVRGGPQHAGIRPLEALHHAPVGRAHLVDHAVAVIRGQPQPAVEVRYSIYSALHGGVRELAQHRTVSGVDLVEFLVGVVAYPERAAAGRDARRTLASRRVERLDGRTVRAVDRKELAAVVVGHPQVGAVPAQAPGVGRQTAHVERAEQRSVIGVDLVEGVAVSGDPQDGAVECRAVRIAGLRGKSELSQHVALGQAVEPAAELVPDGPVEAAAAHVGYGQGTGLDVAQVGRYVERRRAYADVRGAHLEVDAGDVRRNRDVARRRVEVRRVRAEERLDRLAAVDSGDGIGAVRGAEYLASERAVVGYLRALHRVSAEGVRHDAGNRRRREREVDPGLVPGDRHVNRRRLQVVALLRQHRVRAVYTAEYICTVRLGQYRAGERPGELDGRARERSAVERDGAGYLAGGVDHHRERVRPRAGPGIRYGKIQRHLVGRRASGSDLYGDRVPRRLGHAAADHIAERRGGVRHRHVGIARRQGRRHAARRVQPDVLQRHHQVNRLARVYQLVVVAAG